MEMTSISSISAHQSPLSRLQSTLQSDISTGSIQSSDQDALTTALKSIDESLSSSRRSETSSTTPPSRDEMKTKIADLIQKQVEAGTLTSDQASELADVFDQTFSKGAKGAGGPPQGAGGPPPGAGGPPPSDGEQSAQGTDDSSSSGTTIADILKQLQDAISSSNQSAYSASGTTTSSSSTSYLFDLVA